MAVVQVPIVKAKGQTVEVDLDKIPQEVYLEALALGLKTLINRGTSKITKSAYPDADELKAAAVAMAEKQLDLVNTGKIKFTGGAKKSGVSGAVKTEAMRLARNLVKDEMKKAGIKISHVKASEITAAAKGLLESNPSIIELAKAEIDRRNAVQVEGFDVSSIKVDAALVAKAEAKAKSAPLSAKQAGMVKPRVKGKGAQAQAQQ